MLYVDIEVDNLDADFGVVLSWYAKERDTAIYYHASITRKDVEESMRTNRVTTDKRILKELALILPKYDYIVCHYGTILRGLDMRFLRSRFIKYGLKFPVYRQIFGLDTYTLARYRLALHSNRLDSVAKFLGCPIRKTEIDTDVWVLAKYGQEKALKYVIDHNKKDVQILEFVHKKLEAYGPIGMASI